MDFIFLLMLLYPVIIFVADLKSTVYCQGIPPVNKTLEDSDKWVTALCKKLIMWWPWVNHYHCVLLCFLYFLPISD